MFIMMVERPNKKKSTVFLRQILYLLGFFLFIIEFSFNKNYGNSIISNLNTISVSNFNTSKF